jgi:hypothetical protein
MMDEQLTITISIYFTKLKPETTAFYATNTAV